MYTCRPANCAPENILGTSKSFENLRDFEIFIFKCIYYNLLFGQLNLLYLTIINSSTSFCLSSSRSISC